MKTVHTYLYVLIASLMLVLYQQSYAQGQPAVKPATAVAQGIASTTPGNHCGAGHVELHASGHNPADTIKWYGKLVGGSLLGMGTSWTTPAISLTATYYVCTSKRGHASARVAVKATIYASPADPVISPKSTASFCEGGSVKLSIANGTSAVQWSTGATTSAITVEKPGNYTVRVTSATGCTAMSSPTLVSATNIPHIISITPGDNCGHGQAMLAAKADAGLVKWYTSNTATTPISTGGLYFTPTFITTGTTTYYVDATDKGCASARIAVPATIKPMPSITSVVGANRSGTGTLILKAKASKGVVNWYAQAIGGVRLKTDSVFTTPSLSASTTYYAEASLDGCFSERVPVTATVSDGAMMASITQSGAAPFQKASVDISPNPNKGACTITASTDMIYVVTNAKKSTVAEGEFNSTNNRTLALKGVDKGEYHFIGYSKSAFVKEKILVSR